MIPDKAQSYIYLDDIHLHILQCELYRMVYKRLIKKINSYVARQFGSTRFLLHLVPFKIPFISGITVWRHLYDQEIWDRLVFGNSSCNWRNQDFEKWLNN